MNVYEKSHHLEKRLLPIKRKMPGNVLNKEIVISSVLTGALDTLHYTAEYLLKLSHRWQVNQFEISYVLNGISHSVSGAHTPDEWIINRQVKPEFKKCVDIDITLTPFTNSLPINRLRMNQDEPHQLEVLYINVLENRMYPVRQQYTKKSETTYNFQNIPNDFEADIIVDNQGFVVHYPQLFERMEG